MFSILKIELIQHLMLNILNIELIQHLKPFYQNISEQVWIISAQLLTSLWTV